MLSIISTAPPVKPQLAEVLLSRLADAGYLEGPPSHITPATLRIDAQTACRSRCNVCGVPRGKVRFLHKQTSYRCLAVCQKCGFAEEL